MENTIGQRASISSKPFVESKKGTAFSELREQRDSPNAIGEKDQ